MSALTQYVNRLRTKLSSLNSQVSLASTQSFGLKIARSVQQVDMKLPHTACDYGAI
ncbi:hypothetical protein PRUB_a0904 [Pseudoalteromonas rubra]|uniref:Uncharacterized protein n=1 Tax=Pseudoalteromonas rubra TaxID=43658 RepID=A0A8T0C6W6_9GAMM|nr:hypothetical protein PRUB_a0904 [Pseudoalteromonas rubra]